MFGAEASAPYPDLVALFNSDIDDAYDKEYDIASTAADWVGEDYGKE